jgi:hypothetical protein
MAVHHSPFFARKLKKNESFRRSSFQAARHGLAIGHHRHNLPPGPTPQTQLPTAESCLGCFRWDLTDATRQGGLKHLLKILFLPPVSLLEV